MIGFDVHFSGGQLGKALADDPEELAYALEAIFNRDRLGLATDIAELVPPACALGVAKMLRAWANAIEGEAA